MLETVKARRKTAFWRSKSDRRPNQSPPPPHPPPTPLLLLANPTMILSGPPPSHPIPTRPTPPQRAHTVSPQHLSNQECQICPVTCCPSSTLDTMISPSNYDQSHAERELVQSPSQTSMQTTQCCQHLLPSITRENSLNSDSNHNKYPVTQAEV